MSDRGERKGKDVHTNLQLETTALHLHVFAR